MTYPRSIMLSEEPVETLYLHLVGMWQDGSIRYAGVTGCSMEVVGGKLIKLTTGAVEKNLIIPPQPA